jgi:hypothetical protein
VTGNIRLVEFEGHDSDAHIPGLIASFPPHDADPMDIVRLHRPRNEYGVGAASNASRDGLGG